ncbi:MAG TPA: M20/M25/M40 family metallo-hydrolase [Gemmatimonadales bacterium]|jgi:acetylornithine deacetylase|nr:M20/M25/M40 family metallo-hydrolase [Gemmatimonadales bacterium]
MDALELTRALVALETPTGAEGPATDLLESALRGAGYRVARQRVTAGRDNLLAYREPPALVFSTHVDTVPPYLPLSEDDQAIRGRGSCDAKGIAAAMVAAAERLAAAGERRIGLLFLVGEENGSDGARVAADLGPRGRFVINGEPTENRLSIGQKGSLRVDLEASGQPAHSAYPDEGVSATAMLLDTIERIRRMPLAIDPLLGASTLNIGLIGGGVAPNVLAPHATAQILIRTVEPTEGLKATVRALASPGVSVTFPVELPSHRASVIPAGWDTTVVSFASDLPFLAAWGEGYQLGPGSIRVAHSAQEHILKADLLRGVELYVRLATDLLASEAA